MIKPVKAVPTIEHTRNGSPAKRDLIEFYESGEKAAIVDTEDRYHNYITAYNTYYVSARRLQDDGIPVAARLRKGVIYLVRTDV